MLFKKVKKFNKRKILFLFFVVSIFFIFGTNTVKAGEGHNVYGWAWTENIGWINFNNANITGAPGTAEETIIGGGGSNYGVNIDQATGEMTGYAWSENIGWIRFDSTPDTTTYPGCGYPTTPCDSAKVDLQTSINDHYFPVSGWVRVCSVFASGCSGTLNGNRGSWDGWIYLHDITIDQNTDNNGWHQFHQWVWGGSTDTLDTGNTKAVVGWGTFNCAEGSSTGGMYCGTSNYKVVTTLSIETIKNPPGVELGPIASSPCESSRFFSWTYISGDSSDSKCDEASFIFQVSSTGFDSDECNNCEVNETVDSPSGGTQNNQPVPIRFPAAGPGGGSLAYDTTYSWRVKVFDYYGHTSGWVVGSNFTTELHPYPSPNYEVKLSSKTLINGKSTATFSESSRCYVNTGSRNNPNISYYNCSDLTTGECIDGKCYSWWFDLYREPNSIDHTILPTGDTFTHEYTDKGTKGTKLQVCDDIGCCPKTINISIAGPSNVPIWQEISPF
jgi:hypothetical protein